MADNIAIDLSRVEAQLREGPDYTGPFLSRVEKLLYDYVKNAGKLAFRGPYESVDDLPEEGEDGAIYLVDTQDSENYYDEYYWNSTTGEYTAMGTSEIELANYAKKEEVIAAISAVNSAISVEISARQALDTRLSAAISALDNDLSTEVSARRLVEAQLAAAISALDSDLSTEVSARQALDTRLTAAISALNSDLSTEISARETLDTRLTAAISGKTDLTNIASVESSSTASKAYAQNDRLIYNGILYKASTAIAQGDTLTPGTNLTPTTVDGEIAAGGSGHDNTKADKVTGATNGNFAGLDNNGNLVDSGSKASDFLTQHQDISGKADKVSGATNNSLASLTAEGNLADSGVKATDVYARDIYVATPAETKYYRIAYIDQSIRESKSKAYFITSKNAQDSILLTVAGNGEGFMNLVTVASAFGVQGANKIIDTLYFDGGNGYLYVKTTRAGGFNIEQISGIKSTLEITEDYEVNATANPVVAILPIPDDSNLIHLAGAETITGAKTFEVATDSTTAFTVSNDNSGNATYYGLNKINAADTGFSIDANAALNLSGGTSVGLSAVNDISLASSSGKVIVGADDDISITSDSGQVNIEADSDVNIECGDSSELYLGGGTNSKVRVGVNLEVDNSNLQVDGNITSPTISAITDNLGSKNLLKVTMESQVTDNVTYTVNRNTNGECTSIQVSKSANGYGSTILGTSVKLPPGSYILTSGDTTGICYLTLYNQSTSAEIGNTNWPTAGRVEFTLSQETTCIAVSSVVENASVNKIIYPMIRPVGTSADFVPYAPTNREIGSAMSVDNSRNATFAANIVAEGTVTANGSDYAENFPEASPCPVCRFVTLDGEGIRLADGGDYILGVTSEAPSMIGDKDVDGVPVGLLGKLWVEHDGSARVNGFVVCGRDGIATASDAGYRVMAVDGGRCRILVK